MIALNSWGGTAPFSVRGEKISFHGVGVFQVSLSNRPQFLGYRLKKLAKLLRAQRILRYLAPADFPYHGLLSAWGLDAYDPLPYLQSLGGTLLLNRLARAHIPPASASILLQGDVVTPSVTAVAEALCPFVRELVVDFPRGGALLQSHLFQSYGLAPCSFRAFPTGVLAFSQEYREKCGIILQLHRLDSQDFCGIHLKNQGDLFSLSPLLFLGFLGQTGKINKEEIEFT